MMRTPEEQYLHELIESYVAPLRSEIKELSKQLSTEPVKNNGVLPYVMHHVCPDCDGRKYFPDKESTSGKKPCGRCRGTGQIVP